MMRNKDARHIDFAELYGLFDKRLPSNVDMIMERHGRFLIGEWKREGEHMQVGQQILLKQLAKVPKFTVIIVLGDTDSFMHIKKVWKLNADETFKVVATNKDQFKDYLVAWDNDDL